MANYDELNGNMRALYDAAKKELADMEKKRAELENIVNVLSPLYGSSKKTYSVEALKAVEAAAPRASKGRKGAKAVKADKVAKGMKAVKAAKGAKQERIKENVLKSLVVKYLTEVHPKSMAASEILAHLEKDGMPKTVSFRTRVYGCLGNWSKDDGMLERLDRGVYRIKNPKV